MNTLKLLACYENFFIDHRCTLKEAISQMYRNRDGCVVLLKHDTAAGILTESDIVKALQEKIDLDRPASLFATTPVICASEKRPVEFAFTFLSEHNIRRIVLVDDNARFTGVVRQEDLFNYLEEDVYKADLKISDICKSGKTIITVQESAPLHEALYLMQHNRVGSVIVTDDKTFTGILTEKDIVKLTYLEVSMQEKIEAHMSQPVISVSHETLVIDVINLMQRKNIRRVVITDAQNRLLSVLTNRDILKYIKGNYSRILQIKIRHAQEIMDFLPEAIIEIFLSDAHQLIHWMNKKAKAFFGENLTDREVTALFAPGEWQEIYASFQTSSTLMNKRLSINSHDFEISGTLSKNINNRYIKLIFKDVTEHMETKKRLRHEIDRQIEKRLENEYLLMQQSKLATMGEMIGHIAHQWRQPLAQLGGIFMNLDAAYEFGELSPRYLKEKIKNGNALIKYMSHTIDDFRHFFEPNRRQKRFAPADYIRSAVNIIQASLTYYRIALTVKAPEEAIFVTGYPGEFAQVILNLLDNAKDILLERKIKNPKITIETTVSGEIVTISVKDNGGGIDEAIMDQIFDIYFTTKAKRGGSGLGLYMSKLIIESKNMGHIYVVNDSDGALFTITLAKTA